MSSAIRAADRAAEQARYSSPPYAGLYIEKPRLAQRVVCLMLCLISISAYDTSSAQSVETPPDARSIAVDTLFKGYGHDTPGAAVGVYEKGRIVYARGYGMADLEAGTPITPATPFHVASVSKQFTAMSIALLERERKVDLDADIRRYLPFVPDFRHSIAVHNLLFHTSGLRDQWELFGIGGQEIHNVLHQQQIINMVSRQRDLNFPPGADYMYCNTGYTLLAEIVRSASGRSLRQFTNERIFQPLGMTHTFFYDDVREVVPDRAQSYTREGKGPWKRELLNYDNVGATSLLTTVEDLAKWAGNFSQPIVGDRAMIHEISHHGALADGTPIHYAFGLESRSLGGRRVVLHSGSDAAFRALFVYYPDYEFGLAIVTNTDVDPTAADSHLGIFDKAKAIADIYLPKGPQPSVPAVAETVDATPLSGVFLTPFAHSLRLEARHDGLYRQSNSRAEKLVLRANGTFDEGQPEADYFMPIKDAAGHVSAIVEHRPGGARDRRFERVVITERQPESLQEFTGNYHSDELDVTYGITLEGGRLVARALWTIEPSVLTPVVGDHFESSTGDLEIVDFDRNAQGTISGLRAHNGRIRNLQMRRIPR